LLTEERPCARHAKIQDCPCRIQIADGVELQCDSGVQPRLAERRCSDADNEYFIGCTTTMTASRDEWTTPATACAEMTTTTSKDPSN